MKQDEGRTQDPISCSNSHYNPDPNPNLTLSLTLSLTLVGLVVRVLEREVDKHGRLTKIRFEQTIRATAPATGWIKIRSHDGKLVLEPIKVARAPTSSPTQPTDQFNVIKSPRAPSAAIIEA